MKFMESPQRRNSYADWENERARFNHDWLQVRYLTFLQAWQEEIDAAGKDGNLPAGLLLGLGDWKAHRQQLEGLITDAKCLLSPARLVEIPPLDSLPEPQREWLAEVVDSVWLQKSGIASAVEELSTMAQEVDGVLEALSSRQSVENAGAKLYGTCRRLSHALSSLSTAGAFL